jgi:hypothetical protein
MTMRTLKAARKTTVLLAGCLAGACNPIPAPNTSGPRDPDSVTPFTLALQPGSVTGCIMADPSMTRPVTLTVKNDAAVLLTSGGVHYDLTRVAPNVYAGGYWIQMRADLSTRPKTLTLRNDDGSCKWAASAA